MTDKKNEQSVREGLPMSEEELQEWKQSFENIQESIDKVMAEGEDIQKNTTTVQICYTYVFVSMLQ